MITTRRRFVAAVFGQSVNRRTQRRQELPERTLAREWNDFLQRATQGYSTSYDECFFKLRDLLDRYAGLKELERLKR